MSERSILNKLRDDGLYLQFIMHPTKVMAEIAVRQNSWALQYIEKQTPNKIDPENSEHQPFYERGWRDGDLNRIYVEAVSKQGDSLELVQHQTMEIVLLAVKNYGVSVRHINNNAFKTPEVYFAAVQKNGYALAYLSKKIPNKINLNNPDHKYIYDLGWRDGDVDKISWEAVKNSPYALKFVQNKTLEISLLAIENDLRTIVFLDDFNLIAEALDEKVVAAGLLHSDEEISSVFKKIEKIRQSNQISERVNEGVSPSKEKKLKGRL